MKKKNEEKNRRFQSFNPIIINENENFFMLENVLFPVMKK